MLTILSASLILHFLLNFVLVNSELFVACNETSSFDFGDDGGSSVVRVLSPEYPNSLVGLPSAVCNLTFTTKVAVNNCKFQVTPSNFVTIVPEKVFFPDGISVGIDGHLELQFFLKACLGTRLQTAPMRSRSPMHRVFMYMQMLLRTTRRYCG